MFSFLPLFQFFGLTPISRVLRRMNKIWRVSCMFVLILSHLPTYALILQGESLTGKRVAGLSLEIVRTELGRKYLQEQGQWLVSLNNLFKCSLGTFIFFFFFSLISHFVSALSRGYSVALMNLAKISEWYNFSGTFSTNQSLSLTWGILKFLSS